MLPQQGAHQWPLLGPLDYQRLQQKIEDYIRVGRQEDPKFKTLVALYRAQANNPQLAHLINPQLASSGSGQASQATNSSVNGEQNAASLFGASQNVQNTTSIGHVPPTQTQAQTHAGLQQSFSGTQAGMPSGTVPGLSEQQQRAFQQHLAGLKGQIQGQSNGPRPTIPLGFQSLQGQSYYTGANTSSTFASTTARPVTQTVGQFGTQARPAGASANQGAFPWPLNVAPAQAKPQNVLPQNSAAVWQMLQTAQAAAASGRLTPAQMAMLEKVKAQYGAGRSGIRPPGTSGMTLSNTTTPATTQPQPATAQPSPSVANGQGGSPLGSQPARPAGGSSAAAVGGLPTEGQRIGFTDEQLYTLKMQIMAFKKLKRGERLSQDLLAGIVPRPKKLGTNAFRAPNQGSPAAGIPRRFPIHPPKVKTPAELKAEQEQREREREARERARKDARAVAAKQKRRAIKMAKEAAEGKTGIPPPHLTMYKPVNSQLDLRSPLSLLERPVHPQAPVKLPPVRRYHGPLFDFVDAEDEDDEGAIFGPPQEVAQWGPPMPLAYDPKDILQKVLKGIVDKRKKEELEALEHLLGKENTASNRDLPPEVRIKLRIYQRKLRLMELQAGLRDAVEEEQQEIMLMNDRQYRKFLRWSEKEKLEHSKQVAVMQKAVRERLHKAVFSWRKKVFDSAWVAKESRAARNKGVARYHEKMNKDWMKRKDEDRSRRMEALKANDVDQYRRLLEEQQKTTTATDATERFQALSDFLSQTEDYLRKLGGKVHAVKAQAEREEQVLAAVAEAKARGLSEEEAVEEGVRFARELVESQPDPGVMATGSAAVSQYYSLAHTVTEQVLRQPSLLKGGQLREYQMVGLQWMVSLYNNKLNGILADEMGLGKTVQCMALLAYLMELKGNKGPHLIIVPNAVIVNWKGEFLRWLPMVNVVVYVGSREHRTRIFQQDVASLKFNVLVTTYEFIMRDRAKLSKVDWKYCIIDEAQRMKDRESRLSRDLDRFRCQRRLLLTGTPLQNDLNELWSLLNLLLPEVFDNSRQFHEWFDTPFGSKEKANDGAEDDWLETEKKIIVIHRLHQILEPFMLRRRVEDVEGSLPPKITHVLKCKMSGVQAAIYDWVKATGTLRLDPEVEAMRVANTNRITRSFAPLQNKCMELRKVCNHPYLTYPPRTYMVNKEVVRICGKLSMLDRILIKLHRTGHKVLLFSTMTRLLDILEEYLRWRHLEYRRIDGATSLEMRESSITDFNAPDSNVFIFLLSIRAAGRGLNLQTADTVVVYDPDPNPKNEEQAVARAHRIGQKREVRVIHMEAVVESVPSYETEERAQRRAELIAKGEIDEDDKEEGTEYLGSIESLVRANIQQHKIDMADEVINAGRFDQRTTQEERRVTLEALLHDEDRYQQIVHEVPSLHEVNCMIARSDEELEIFDRMDEEDEWPGPLMARDEIPDHLKADAKEVEAVVALTTKQPLRKAPAGPTAESLAAQFAAEGKVLGRGGRSANKQAALDKEARGGMEEDFGGEGRQPVAEDVGGEEGQLVAPVGEEEEEEQLYGEEEDAWRRVAEEPVEEEEEEAAALHRRALEAEEEEEPQEETHPPQPAEDEEPEEEEEVEPEEEFQKPRFQFQSLLDEDSRIDADLEEGEIPQEETAEEEEPPAKKQREDVPTPPKNKGFRSIGKEARASLMKDGKIPIKLNAKAAGKPPRPAGISTTWTGLLDVNNEKPLKINLKRKVEPEEDGGGVKKKAKPVVLTSAEAMKKCKEVVNRLKAARDGGLVPADLVKRPKRSKHPEYYELMRKPVDVAVIEARLDRGEYDEVRDLAADVMLMFSNALRWHSKKGGDLETQSQLRRMRKGTMRRLEKSFPDSGLGEFLANVVSKNKVNAKGHKVKPEEDKPQVMEQEDPVKEQVIKREDAMKSRNVIEEKAPVQRMPKAEPEQAKLPRPDKHKQSQSKQPEKPKHEQPSSLRVVLPKRTNPPEERATTPEKADEHPGQFVVVKKKRSEVASPKKPGLEPVLRRAKSGAEMVREADANVRRGAEESEELEAEVSERRGGDVRERKGGDSKERRGALGREGNGGDGNVQAPANKKKRSARDGVRLKFTAAAPVEEPVAQEAPQKEDVGEEPRDEEGGYHPAQLVFSKKKRQRRESDGRESLRSREAGPPDRGRNHFDREGVVLARASSSSGLEDLRGQDDDKGSFSLKLTKKSRTDNGRRRPSYKEFM